MATSTRLPDSDLDILVDRAAQGAWDSRAQFTAAEPFADLDRATQTSIKEQALPFIFYGTKALAELGYVKPRTITSVEELLALPNMAVILDGDTDVWQKRGGSWSSHETAIHSSERLVRYAPFTVLSEGEQS